MSKCLKSAFRRMPHPSFAFAHLSILVSRSSHTSCPVYGETPVKSFKYAVEPM